MTDLVEKAKAGTQWVMVSQLVKPVWEFLVGIALARVLTPKDFGVVAMGMIFVSLASALSNLGVSNVIIQKESLEPADLRSCQTVSALVGLTVSIVLAAVSPLVNLFFLEPAAGAVLAISGVNFVLSGIFVIPSALLTRAMRFKAQACIEIFSSLIYGGTALLLAYRGFGLWSLVYSPIASSIFALCATCFTASYLPRFGWDRSAGLSALKFGGTLSLASILNYSARNLDYFIIGRCLGASPLGTYKRAYDLAVIPKEKIAESLSKVYFPLACNIRGDITWSRSAFLKTTRFISLFCFPVLILFVTCGDQVIATFYGEQWLDSVGAFRIMAVGGIFYSLIVPFGGLLIAFGKSKRYLLLQTFYSIFLLVATFLGIRGGITGVAAGVSVSLLLMLILNFIAVKELIQLKAGEYLRNLRTSMSIAFFYLTLAAATGYLFQPGFNILISRTLLLIVVLLAHFAFSKDETLQEILAFAAARLQRVAQQKV